MKRTIRKTPIDAAVTDGLTNVVARLGQNGTNAFSGGTYRRSGLTQNQQLLETMYEGSWVAGKLVDCIAEDMTRAGITIHDPSDQAEAVQAEITEKGCWDAVTETIQWARLYGGALAVINIEGQDWASPLRLDAVTRGSFTGLTVFDRWRVTPSVDQVIPMGRDAGLPVFYTLASGQKVHHSRVLRQIGTKLPYWAAQRVQGWGGSVLERLDDRILAYDSSLMGVANLMFKLHLRTMKIKGYRDICATGGQTEEALIKSLKLMQTLQTNEGLTVMDAEDEFATHSYTFAGVADVLTKLEQQISGGGGIPLVRLFGQSPDGMNASGDADFRNYYDNVHSQQESRTRQMWDLLLQVAYRSRVGSAPPQGFAFQFTSLWQMSDIEKGTLAKTTVDAVVAVEAAGIISKGTALRELQAASHATGFGASITDEDVDAADEEPPLPTLPEGATLPGDEQVPTTDGWRKWLRRRS